MIISMNLIARKKNCNLQLFLKLSVATVTDCIM